MELSINSNLELFMSNCKEGQLLNAANPILLTEDGVTNFCNEVQPLKVLSPMLVTEDGIANSCNEVQSLKAP